MKHIKELDSFRALAVIAVVASHWIPENSSIQLINPGSVGVNIFFVLSGFLITQILLVNRHEAEAQLQPKRTVLKNFYGRRFLRIFPVYYLLIALMVAFRNWLQLPLSKAETMSSLTYTSNFYFYATQKWTPLTAHFWSLAVEEQFYLLWPFIILFPPRKYLLQCIGLFIAIGIISQQLATPADFGGLLPYTCFDALGAGALLAWIKVYRPDALQKFFKVSVLLAVIGVLILSANIAGCIRIESMRAFLTCISVCAVGYVLLPKTRASLARRMLQNKLLIFIGKISYGIYLYHLLYLWIVGKAWRSHVLPHLTFIPANYQAWAFLLLNFGVLVFFCWLSWQFIERPILSLKKHFAYKDERTKPALVMLPKTETAL